MAKRTLFVHAEMYTPGGVVEDGWLLAGADGTIEKLGGPGDREWTGERGDAELVDCGGKLLLPGLIDIHVHGGGGFDVLSGTREGLEGMSRFHAAHGTTAFLATTATVAHDRLLRALRNAAACVGKTSGAELCGIHLEGPFLAATRRGAQSLEHIQPPERERIDEVLEAAGGRIRIVTLAPEREGGTEAVRYFRERGVTVSAGHTDATFAEMKAAVAAGATQTTHHFNGMRPFHHRDPGAAGAGLLLAALTTELVCDGFHVHPEAVRLLFEIKKPEGVCLITDALFCAGLPDGAYGSVVVRGGEIMLSDGSSLAGSALTTLQALRNAMTFTGLPLESVLPSLTKVPARQAGLLARKGSLEAGKDADVLLLDSDLKLEATYVRGRLVYDAKARPAGSREGSRDGTL